MSKETIWIILYGDEEYSDYGYTTYLEAEEDLSRQGYELEADEISSVRFRSPDGDLARILEVKTWNRLN